MVNLFERSDMNELRRNASILNQRFKEKLSINESLRSIILLGSFSIFIISIYLTHINIFSIFQYFYIFSFGLPLWVVLFAYLASDVKFRQSILIYFSVHVFFILIYYTENFTSYSIFFTKPLDYDFSLYLYDIYTFNSNGFIELLNKLYGK